MVFTTIAIGISFGWLGVESAEKWKVGLTLYMIGREFREVFLPFFFLELMRSLEGLMRMGDYLISDCLSR
jgi:hypothetical protein